MAVPVRPAILPGLVPDEFFDAEFPALPLIERANAFIEFLAELPELLDVRQPPPPDLFLIGIREGRDLRNRLFERLHHSNRIDLRRQSIK